MATSKQKDEYAWVPPAWEMDDSGNMKFASEFALNDYKAKWTDEEKEVVRQTGIEGFSSIVERDRKMMKRLGENENPLEDPELFKYTRDRNLQPEGEGFGAAWGALWGFTKAGADVIYNKMTPKHAFDLATDFTGTIKDDLGLVAAGGVNAVGEIYALANGVKNLAMKAMLESDDESLERQRTYLLASQRLGADIDSLQNQVADVMGLDHEHLKERAEFVGELFDPFELPIVGQAFSVGAKAAGKVGFGSKVMTGPLDGLGKELLDTKLQRLAKEAAGEKADDLVSMEAALQTKYNSASAAMHANAAKTGIGRRVTGGAAERIGRVSEGAGNILHAGGEWVSRKIDDPTIRNLATHAVGTSIGAAVGGASGGVAGAVVGGAIGGAGAPVLRSVGRDLQALGKLWRIGDTTQPMLRNLRQDMAVSGPTKFVAGVVDPMANILRPVAETAGRAVRGGVRTAAAGGAFGYVAGGGESLDSVITSAAAGVPLGVMGGVASAWHPYYKASQDIVIRENQRALVEDRYVPNTPSRKAWDQLDHGQQTAAAVYLHAHPDVDLKLTDVGAGWAKTIDGRPTIAVNPKSANPMKSIVAHELGHNALSRGLKTPILRELLGSVLEGKVGQYTKVDANGNPVVSKILDTDNNQVYETTQEFKDLKEEYEKRLVESPGFEGDARLSDADAAFEIAAELNADFMINGGFEKAIGGTRISGLFTSSMEEGFLRNMLGSFGVSFDADGPIKTPVFKELRRNKDLTKIFKQFYKSQSRGSEPMEITDADGGVQFSRKEISTNPEIIGSFLNSNDLNIDPSTGLPRGVVRVDGKLQIVDESQMYRSPKQARESQQAFAQSVMDAIDSLEGQNDQALQRRVTEDGRVEYAGKFIDPKVLDMIEAEGIHNPNQIANLREINNLLQQGEGDPMLFFYQPTENRPIGGRKRIKGAFAGHWRNEVPYGLKIDGNGNIHAMTVSPDALVTNMTRAWMKNKSAVRDTWASRQNMIGDMATYLQNVSNGLAGDTNLSTEKMKKLNAMMGIKGRDRKNVNPYFTGLSVTSQSWLTSRRLDRMNKGSPVSGDKLPWGAPQNEQVKQAYLPETLRHFSSTEGLSVVDPKFHGQGLLGAERQRKRDYPELYVDRSYFGRPGYVKEDGLGQFRYETTMDTEDLYDFYEDPDDVYDRADDAIIESGEYAQFDETARVTMMEKLLHEDGWRGYRSKQVVALFKKQKVQAYMPETSDTTVLAEDFLTYEGMKAALPKTGWLAMEGTPQGKTHSSAEGVAGQENLQQWLDDNGVQNVQVVGRYRDPEQGVQDGPSWLVFGIEPVAVPELAKQFDQESIATNRGLVYQDGSVVPATALHTGAAAEAQDFATIMPDGKAFSFDLDFDNKQAFMPEQSGVARSSRTIMEGTEDFQFEKAGKKPRLYELAKALAQRSAVHGVPTVKNRPPQQQIELENAIFDEIDLAVSQNETAIGWYDEHLTKAVDMMAVAHPEIATDPVAEMVFKSMLAITSNGIDVVPNFRQANVMYQKYKDTGKIGDNGKWGGKSAGAMKTGFQNLQKLIDTMGPTGARDFLFRDFKVKDLKAMGFKISGENMGTSVKGAMVFGPKIGSFFNNLYGDYSTITMDRWFMRTWNRMTGSLTDISPIAIAKQAKRLRKIIAEGGYTAPTSSESRRTFTPDELTEAMTDDDMLLTVSKEIRADYERGGWEDRTELNKAGKNYAESFNKLNEAPKGGSERIWIRETFARVQKRRADEGLPALTNADAQAILWYYEKDLYRKLGYSPKGAAPADYIDGALSVYADLGLPTPDDLVGRQLSSVDPTAVDTGDGGTGPAE